MKAAYAKQIRAGILFGKRVHKGAMTGKFVEYRDIFNWCASNRGGLAFRAYEVTHARLDMKAFGKKA
jgi:hypothetical protein